MIKSLVYKNLFRFILGRLQLEATLADLQTDNTLKAEFQARAQKEIIDILKAYPKEYELFKKRMDQIWDGLDKLKKIT